jgi:hypothetical protein
MIRETRPVRFLGTLGHLILDMNIALHPPIFHKMGKQRDHWMRVQTLSRHRCCHHIPSQLVQQAAQHSYLDHSATIKAIAANARCNKAMKLTVAL